MGKTSSGPAEQGELPFYFLFPCSTAWFVARERLRVPPHLCASLARTPRAGRLGCKGQFEVQPLVLGLQRAARVTPAAFSSLPSRYVLRLKERSCSSSPLALGKAQGNRLILVRGSKPSSKALQAA